MGGEYSCPPCGFEADREANATWNVFSRDLQESGVIYSEATSAETAVLADTRSVSAKFVVEAESPAFTERDPRGRASRTG